MANEFKFQASPVAQAVNKKLFIKRLPEWMQSLEQIQTFSDDIIQQWFNPAEQEIIDGYIGDHSSPASSGKIFLDELTQQRQDYQLSPAYVSKNEDTSVRSLQFYEDLVGYMEHYGCLTNNQSRLFDGKFYSWTPPINPNKIMNFSSYIWDNNNEYGIQPDYVVMERGANNGNTWSLQNFWYTLGQTLPDGTLLTEEMMQDSRFIRAAAPIIEYNKNIELLNYGTKFRGVVDYFSDSVKPEDIVQKSTSENIRIDGYILKAGDRVLFSSIGNEGENNRIYKVYIKQMKNGRRVYGLTLDEDEESESRPTGEPQSGDVILVKKGNVYSNTSLYWNGKSWVRAQAKTGINTFPMFQLYDRNGVKLDNSVIYPRSTFTGSSIFGLKINYNYNLDKVYNAHVELSSYNYYVFENYLQSIRYEYDNVGVVTEIPGFYYFNIQDVNGDMHLQTDWVRSKDFSKQFVKQTPKITKTAMFRVFDTYSTMESFQEPIENMYAYVIESDSTYQYYKAQNSTFLDWHEISSDAIQSDAYTSTFELAQKIDPNNSNDILEVYVSGIKTNSYTTSLNTSGFVENVTLDESLSINEDTVLEIRTYSKNITPDYNLGSYEIPTNLKNNPYNDSVMYVNQSLYALHFQEVISKNITSGTINDFNDYELRLENGLVDNSVGTNIIQNEASMLPMMINTANEEIDLFEAIMFMQNEYFRFINKFNTQMINLYSQDSNGFLNNTAANIVDQILSTINVGKDSNFPFYLDAVGTTTSGRTFIPPTAQFIGILKLFSPEKSVYLCAGRDIGCYNISHTGVISKAYKVINGVSKMDDVIYELESRIYNSVDNTFKSVDYQPPMDASDLFPTPYFNNTDYSTDEHKELLLRGYINFIASNGISNSTHDYDQQNWMTWNYTGTTYVVNGNPTDIPARGSWRAIYTDMFGTYRPATHPWEMLGFAQRPSWWNQEYKPTKVRLGNDPSNFINVYEAYVYDEAGNLVPSGLWDTTSGQGDASKGVILFGDRAGQYNKYKRFGTQPFKITSTGNFTTDGEEIKTFELIAPEVLGLVSGVLSQRSAPWKYGDMGDIEFTYMNTAMFNFDQALLLYRAKPAQFANYFYDTKNSTLKNVSTDGVQFQYGETNKRLNLNSTTFVHGENNNRVLGYQMFISDYLTYQSKDITSKYGDILRSSYVNIGHKLGGFTKEDQLTFTSESFGLISQENQHIGLVKSSAFRNETLSAVSITWNGSAYVIDGYDLVGATFKTLVPLKNSKKITVTVGKRTVTQNLQYTDTVKSYSYGTTFNTFQEVYSFLCAYGEYLQAHGWIFEDQDSDGNILNWVQMGKDFLGWSQEQLSIGSFISLTPSSKSAKFGSDFGSVQSVTQFNGGVWSLLDDQNQGIRPYEIETTRIGSVFTVRSTEESNKRIALIRLSLVSYEHAIVFDDTTIFNDSIYIPTFGSVQELIRVYGYVTGSWNGRLEAPGFIILETGTLPDFEKLVDDFKQYYDTENPVSEVILRDLSRHLIGYQTRDYLQQMISSEPNRVDFYKGFIRDKGTNNVLERVLRVSKSYNTQSYQALQEWAFKIGEYGNIYGKKNLQFQLINNEFKQQPQLITFDQNSTESTDTNSILYYGKQGDDSRWITRPHGNTFSFPMRSGMSDNIHLPNIGPVTLDEVSFSTVDINTAYIDRRTYINNTGKNPDSVWMFIDSNGNWNIFDIVNTGITIESITPIITDGEFQTNTHSTLKMSDSVNMTSGDIYFFMDESQYMPDALKYETQYYTSSAAADEILYPLGNSLSFTFTDDKPVLYRYVSRFATDEEKSLYVSKKYSYDAPQSNLFDRPSTYNSQTNETELYLNIFDPINGVFPGIATQDISFISPVDPAMYNSNGETLQAWGAEKVGQVWWNTTEAYYMDYTRPVYDINGNVDIDKTIEYKRYNWGKLLPRGKIDILEWVCSPVLPYEWDKYCNEQAKLNKNNSTSYTPSGTAIEDSYSEFIEYDANSNTYVTKYYFWVRDTIYVPPYNNRSRSCNEISRIINDPTVLSTPWFAPIDKNSFIISNMQYDVNDDKSILTISYKENNDEVTKHEQYQLCQEGEHYNFNPSIWGSLWDSLKSYTTLDNGTQVELNYPSTELGLGSNKTWFENVIEARRTLVDTANEIYKGLNMTTNTVVMNEVFNVKTTEKNPNEISFKVLTYNNELVISPSETKFVENDAVLVSTTGTLPSPLTSTNVYFVHFDENNYIRLMNSPSTSGSAVVITLENKGEGQHSMIKQSDYIESLATSLDMTQYWSLADWYNNGYNEFSEYTKEVSIQDANTKNYQEGDLIRITDADGVWTLYVKTLSRDVVVWEAVGRQNSTIKLNSTWYSGYNQYNSDGSLTNQEINVRKALSLLQNSFNSYQSDVVFDMVKYVHTEQKIVDWVFKTSYIYIVGLEQSLEQNYSNNDDLINQIVEYFEEVKPYRTKIRSQIEKKTSNQDEINGVMNDLDPNGYIFSNGSWVKSQKDIWDYEYAQFNENTNKWEIVGQLPSDFELPNRRFQEVDTILVYDNVQCKPDSTLKTVLELEAVDNKYKSQSNDFLPSGSEYKLQRFEYTFPTGLTTNIEMTIGSKLQLIYNNLNMVNGLSSAINTLFTQFKDDITATEKLQDDINNIVNDVFSNDTSLSDIKDYTQYNTLSNRLKLYTEMSDEQIDQSVDCPFKGLVLSDNPNTRLPFGYGASSEYNYGYASSSLFLFEKMVNLAKEQNPTFNTEQIYEYLEYEYGMYTWKYDLVSNGRFFTDAVLVLSTLRNIANPNSTDEYEIAKSMLMNMDYDSQCIIMIPRKYMYVRDSSQNNSNFITVPMERGLEEYIEEVYSTTNVMLSLAQPNFDDLPLEKDNPLLCDYKSVIEGINNATFFNDMNSFDNLALESQTRNVNVYSTGIATVNSDSSFIDISELNPSKMDVSQLRFTVQGYNFDTVVSSQLKNQGRFAIEGFVLLNPYNKSEVMISIPKYNQAISYMERDLLSREEIKYTHRVKNIINTSGIVEFDSVHDLEVGDKVAVFVPNAENYEVAKKDGTWESLLDVSTISSSARPIFFNITAVNGNVVTIDGLTFNNTYDSRDETLFARYQPTSISVVRVTSFTDAEFTDGSIVKYTNDREYRIDMLNYEVFYDIMLSGGDYNDGYTIDDYDYVYNTNELVENQDGTISDHGYYLPIYGEGVLSELVRAKVTESVQIFVYEYDTNTINPTLNSSNIWTYSLPVVDDVYIDSNSTCTSIIVDSEQNGTLVAKPESTSSATILNGIINTGNFGEVIAVNNEIVIVRNNRNILRGYYGTPEPLYISGISYTKQVLNYGIEKNIKIYTSNDVAIPLNTYSTGIDISGTVISSLLK